MTDPIVQRRRYPRYESDLEVIVSQGAKVSRGRITNISRGGCLIFPPLPMGESPEVKVSFRLAADMPYINCIGEVIYTIMDRGTGIAFREISIYNQDLITNFFEKKLPIEKPAGV